MKLTDKEENLVNNVPADDSALQGARASAGYCIDLVYIDGLVPERLTPVG